ncbi:MAG: sigma-E factor regulatory protein RseB domain-containing protein [Jatrophihabitans sp.]
MTCLRRWLAVLAGIAVLVSLPAAVGALPVTASAVSAAELLGRVQRSAPVGYSGYAESTGGLALPVTSQFSALSDLFGGQAQLRVWWRSATDWRLDSIDLAGETDVHNGDLGYWSWNYEANSATFVQQPTTPEIRLPTDADLLPPELGRRLLSEATAAEASRIGAARVAGISAPGLRIRPADPVSTIDHIDVWADQSTGLPLRVAVYGKSGGPAVSSSFLDVSIATPAPASTAFSIPAKATLHTSLSQDLATTIDQLGGSAPPTQLAGIARNALLPAVGSVGVYGRGVSEFVVVPLPRRVAFSLRRQLAPAVAAAGGSAPTSSAPSDLVLSVGPLNLLLSSFDNPSGPWLLIGTVTGDTLAKAAGELPAQTGTR